MAEEMERDPLRDAALCELCDVVLDDDGVEASDEARRSLLEMLALMPYALDEAVPPASAKAALAARVAGEVATAPTGAPHPGGRVVDPPAPVVAGASAPPALPRWALPLAATLLVAVATLALVQSSELRSQREALARFDTQIAAVEREVENLRSDRDRARTLLASVSRPGTEVCALRPRLAGAPEGAHGTLYMLPDGDGWLLSLAGLEDVPGRTYQMWFLADGTAVSAGTFETGNRPYSWRNERMPPVGTRAVAITLEPAGGVTAPSGPEVLFGDAEDMVSFL